ncbi:helix-turn-helix domain-containing protein [Streptomyces sviceus]|uniref:helix-turn-helix domain-containing protein n=1 Tax=Streptomyces sviceus TaxID=285530 RepID=UPI003319A3AD
MARPEKEIPANAPLEVKELAGELRVLRRRAGLTYQNLSSKSHYSTATLSAAASGNTVPKWEVIRSFVRACGVTDKDELDRWKRLYEDAHARVEVDKVVMDKVVTVDPTPAPQEAVTEPEADKSNGSSWRGRKTAESPTSVQSQLDDTTIVPELPDGLLALVRHFVDYHAQLESKFPDDAQRVKSLTVDHLHTALALCTTPGDVLSLMREVVADKGLTIGDLERRSKPFYPISGATFAQVLNGTELPTTEWLHIFLRACGVNQEHTLIWHYTITRIKIATLRHRTSDTPPPLLPKPPRPEQPPVLNQTSFLDRPFMINVSVSTLINAVVAVAVLTVFVWQLAI